MKFITAFEDPNSNATVDYPGYLEWEGHTNMKVEGEEKQQETIRWIVFIVYSFLTECYLKKIRYTKAGYDNKYPDAEGLNLVNPFFAKDSKMEHGEIKNVDGMWKLQEIEKVIYTSAKANFDEKVVLQPSFNSNSIAMGQFMMDLLYIIEYNGDAPEFFKDDNKVDLDKINNLGEYVYGDKEGEVTEEMKKKLKQLELYLIIDKLATKLELVLLTMLVNTDDETIEKEDLDHYSKIYNNSMFSPDALDNTGHYHLYNTLQKLGKEKYKIPLMYIKQNENTVETDYVSCDNEENKKDCADFFYGDRPDADIGSAVTIETSLHKIIKSALTKDENDIDMEHFPNFMSLEGWYMYNLWPKEGQEENSPTYYRLNKSGEYKDMSNKLKTNANMYDEGANIKAIGGKRNKRRTRKKRRKSRKKSRKIKRKTKGKRRKGKKRKTRKSRK